MERPSERMKIDWCRTFQENSAMVTSHPQKFCQEGFAKKQVNTVFMVNILSAKMKALKIADRDSI
jgi:hypothetical protein